MIRPGFMWNGDGSGGGGGDDGGGCGDDGDGCGDDGGGCGVDDGDGDGKDVALLCWWYALPLWMGYVLGPIWFASAVRACFEKIRMAFFFRIFFF